MAHASNITKLPGEVLAKLIGQVYSDPQVPVSNPTVPTWQEPPHPLAETQSDNLSPAIDFAIIGSGITGCSVAKHLLEDSRSANRSVTVFEARTLTSGATSRNAGFLLSHIPSDFKDMVEIFGNKSAIGIAKLCQRTVKGMKQLAESLGPDTLAASEKRPVRAILSFSEKEVMKAALESIALYEEIFPEEKGSFSTITPETLDKVYQVKGFAGALATDGEVLWPYRLVTRIFADLLRRYSSRFSIETKTPVTSIAYSPTTNDKYPFILTTPRGVVRAGQVLHCTNAWGSHLVPNLRGKILPTRHINSCQRPGPKFPKLGNKLCWMWFILPSYDPASGIVDTGLYYMQQNGETHDLFFGGNRAHIEDIINADDSIVSLVQGTQVSTLLPKLFNRRWDNPATGEVQSSVVDKVWSGIIGATPDHLPLVGSLPASITGRGEGEWIAAGYNGYGMVQCLSTGEALARMALGDPQPVWLPDMLLPSEERLTDEARMGLEAALSSALRI
ncbi:NAD(P)/FAD-dependent oxidoreductase [Aspergillus tanneri]|uniref:FAD dependent oxidoreductase domain-containing protein n=1 Tax=Aspergillus tanneri TaxID=1220188 RepID=A0A5M9M5G5_9EURO|nr:uncharacterized protein ATNIH1004_010890 [Aspergillus tanneri]KAA8641951.1 hypothetical protein ATNIH1004_010890 [Aspergillus tanneri]